MADASDIPVSVDPAAAVTQQTLAKDGDTTEIIRPPSAEIANHQMDAANMTQVLSPDAISGTPIPATGSQTQSQPPTTSQNNNQPPTSSQLPLPIPPSLLKRRPSTSRQCTEDFDPNTHDQLYASIPEQLRQGTVMLKISAKKTQRRMVRLKAEAGQVVWESKHAGMLNIENIRELRFAGEARGFREQFRIAPDCESRWLSIIYTCSGKYKILHLVALSSDNYELWRNTLLKLYEQRRELQMGGLDQFRKRQNIWLKQHYSNADLDNDKILDFRDVTALVKNLNISASDKDMKINFERADSKKRGYLDFADFQLFVKYLRRRPEVEAIMRNVSGSLDSISLDQFERFLRDTQKSNLQDTAIENLYNKFSDSVSDSSSKRTMTIEGFTSFLLSSDNMAMDERQLTICDDMTRPLCEYYVSSSHNTYLVGGQLKGESTAEGYIRALQQGCRSVELDVWDGPDEPVIYHGRTLTSKLPAREALAAIGKYAFIASPFPLILSMEVHCDQVQQDKLAEILKTTLGKSLIDSPLYGENIIEELANCPIVDILPSPEKLKYRIMVKAKNLYVVKAAAQPGEKVEEDKESEESSSASSDSDLKKIFSSAMRLMRRESNATPPTSSPPPPPGQKAGSYFASSSGGPVSPSKSGFSSSSTGPAPAERQLPALEPTVSRDALAASSSSSSSSKRLSLSRLRSRSSEGSTAPLKSGVDLEEKKKEKPLMSFALAGLIVYTVGVKWRGLNKKEQYGASHVISLGERRANKIIKEARNDLISHNRTHIIRSYPAGTRFTSSNYLPQYFWAAGVQLVALNWQTYDLGTEINAAFFQRNGRSGYILKPEILRMKRDGEKDKEALTKVEKYFLNIEVLSAQQLPRPRESDWDDEGTSSGSGTGSSVGSDGSGGNPLTRMLSGSSSQSSGIVNDKPGITVEKEKEVKNVAMNPYIEIAVHTPTVSPGDVYKFKTPMVRGNGFNPVFDSKFRIPFTVPPDMLDLAFLRLEVMVKFGGDELSLGKYTVSLPVLMPGYRHVPLYDHLGQQYLFSSLFICTQLERSQ